MATRERSKSSGVQSILCAIDFSLPSYAALQSAIQIARRNGGRVTALCVDDPLLGAGAAASGYDTALLRKSTIAQLERLLKRMAGPAGLEEGAWSVEALSGKPGRTIIAFAKKISADLIVMGTNGRTGPAKLFFGSVADEVLRKAPVPVLIVARRRPTRSTKAPQTSPILGAIDLGPHEAQDARRMARMASMMGGSLTLLHVVNESAGLPAFAASLQAHHQNEHERAARRLAAIASSVGAGHRVVSGRPEDEIAAAAKKVNAALIILALRRGRGIFGRRQGATTYRVLSSSTTPVLALPPE